MATAVTKPTMRATHHRYYFACAIGFALLVFLGFARTYYLKHWFVNDPLPLLVHIHGVVMTLWYSLFLVQVTLIARRRVALHRQLGWAGIVLSGLVLVMGASVAIGLVRRTLAVHPNSQGAPFLLGMLLFGVLAVFAVLIILAVYWRRRGDYHKRLMTLAMLSVLGPAITRLPFLPNHIVWLAAVVNIGCLVVLVTTDTVLQRRLHPAFGWGAAGMIAITIASAQFCQTKLWINFVHRTLGS